MKVLVVGGMGSIGKRYVAILKYLGYNPVVWDIKHIDYKPGTNTDNPNDNYCIIASPTYTHLTEIMKLHHTYGHILCEKPMGERMSSVLNIPDDPGIHMVCNWVFLHAAYYGETLDHRIVYDCYDCGNESIGNNLAQPIYLSSEGGEFIYSNRNPNFLCRIDGHSVSLEQFGDSYITMIEYWLEGHTELFWTKKDALKMHKAIYKFETKQ